MIECSNLFPYSLEYKMRFNIPGAMYLFIKDVIV